MLRPSTKPSNRSVKATRLLEPAGREGERLDAMCPSMGVRSHEVGTMLLITMNVVVVLSALAAAFLTVAHGDNQEHQASSSRVRALYIAEAGVSCALVDLSGGGDGVLGSADNPVAFSDGEYYVECRSEGATDTLFSVGTFRDIRVGIEATVHTEAEEGYFRGASGSLEMTQVLDNASVDSYDSTAGSYVSQRSGVTDADGDPVASASGDIMSNGPVSIGPGATVFGDALTDTVLAPVVTSVTGTTRPLDTALQFPPVLVPDVSGLSSANIDTSSDAVIPSGTHNLHNLRVRGTATVLVVGPATIVAQMLQIEDSGTLLIDATAGPVIIYPREKFFVETDGTIATVSTMPKDLVISADIDNSMGAMGDLAGDPAKPVQVRDNGTMTGVLYAPDATIFISDSGQLFGAVFGKRVNITGDGALHFDESLSNTQGIPVGGDAEAMPWPTSSAGGSVSGDLFLKTWRIVSSGSAELSLESFEGPNDYPSIRPIDLDTPLADVLSPTVR